MQIHLQTESKSGLQTSLLKALCVVSTPGSMDGYPVGFYKG